MKDPYEVLGVGKNASMDEIKSAYKELIKKYHPDKYQDNPLADLAEEKLKEINEAYEYLSNVKGGSSNYGNTSSYNYGGGSGNAGGYGSNSGASSEMASVRTYIDMGNLDAAATILSNSSERSAEWYFLSGMVAYRRGWYDQAQQLVAQAASMDPNNFEYRRNLEAMRGRGFQQSSPYQRTYTQGDIDDIFCRACQAYMCLDCLCDCF